MKVNPYLEAAARYGLRIEAIVETHVHADHRSGARRLAERTRAAIYLHRSAPVVFPTTPLDEGSEISLGNVVLRVMHTPGHTPDSICLLVTDRTRGDEPWMALTGDTLFVGDVGRPDFGGVDAARSLFDSVQRKLLALPDYLEVYPAHFSGSPCGRAMSGKPASTIGFERRFNPAVAGMGEDDFVTAITTGVPSKPADLADTLAFNRGLPTPDHA